MERNELTDEQLVLRYRDGSEPAFRVLVERYLTPVYNFVHRYAGNDGDAADIAQDVFVSVWRNIRRFDADRQFKTWLFAIAKNAALNWVKKKRPSLFSQFETEEHTGGLADMLADASQSPEALMAHLDHSSRLSAVLGRIGAMYRTVLELRYTEGRTLKEIASALGEPLHTVKSRHRRGLLALRKLLEE